MQNIIKARCVASKEKLLAVSGLLSGAIIWGLIWYPYRLLEQMGVSGALSSFATYLIPLLLGFTLYSERLRLRHFPPILLLVGLTAGWTNLAYVLAVIDGEVMRVLLLFYLSPRPARRMVLSAAARVRCTLSSMRMRGSPAAMRSTISRVASMLIASATRISTSSAG